MSQIADLTRAMTVFNKRSVPVSEHLLQLVSRKLPVVAQTLNRFGHYTLLDYVKTISTCTHNSFQPRQDLAQAIQDYAGPLLGEDLARKAGEALIQHPVALTANHHGVDYFAQSVQSSLIFSLRSNSDHSAQVVPVFACGNVPLNNMTYPRGALIYSSGCSADSPEPLRLPLFPDRYKRKMVCQAPPLNKAMIERARRKTLNLLHTGKLGEVYASSLLSLLSDTYGDPGMMGCHSYSDQAVKLNGAIWQQMFAEPQAAPQLLYLEMEKLVSLLLLADLNDRASLVYRLIGNPLIYNCLFHELDGRWGCWSGSALNARYCRKQTGSATGTFLFWGIDPDGHRVPLAPIQQKGKPPSLCGRTDKKTKWQIPLTPSGIAEALQAGCLLPSLFTSYFVLALSRGINCLGGYYQAAYLPEMQRGLLAALSVGGASESVIQSVKGVPTTSYLSGMQAVLGASEQGGLSLAGPVEIIAGGGLSQLDIERIKTTSVLDAHIASLPETLADAAPELLLQGWQARLSYERYFSINRQKPEGDRLFKRS